LLESRNSKDSVVLIKIELKTHIDQIEQFNLATSKGLLILTIRSLKRESLTILGQQFQTLLHNLVHLIKDTLTDLMRLNKHIIFILLISVLLNSQILNNGDQNLTSVH
jgi:hypothetical protein